MILSYNVFTDFFMLDFTILSIGYLLFLFIAKVSFNLYLDILSYLRDFTFLL